MTSPELWNPSEMTYMGYMGTRYRGLGDITPDPQELFAQLKLHRAAEAERDNELPLIHASICLDLAAQSTRPEVAERLLDEGEGRLQRLFDGEIKSNGGGKDYFQAGILLSYWHKFKAIHVEGRQPTIDDEAELWHKLINPAITKSDIMPGSVKAMAELGVAVHALNARNNLRYDEVVWHTCPALPRQYRPAGDVTDPWAIGVNPEGFGELNQAKYKLFHSVRRSSQRRRFKDSSLGVLSLDRDLTIPNSNALLEDLRRESELLMLAAESGLNTNESSELNELTHRHDEYGRHLDNKWQKGYRRQINPRTS